MIRIMDRRRQPFTEEHKKKIGDANRGRKMSEESKEKNRISHIGKVTSLETRKKLSEASKGRPSVWKGKKRSDEFKQKISLAFTGEKHPHWKGGISKLPYSVDWTETLRRSIRERDNYVCQLCSKQQGDKAHDVHHIDYDKKNCNPINLITLCNSCHTKTNHNREYRESLLSQKMLQKCFNL